MQELLDKYTGEIVKRQFATNRYIPFTDYSKNDKPSLTAPDQVEPLQVIVARCMRGEMIEQKQVYYESDYNKDGDLIGDVSDSPGFDIADVSDVLESAGNAGMTSATADVAKPSSEDNSEVKPEAQASSEVKG